MAAKYLLNHQVLAELYRIEKVFNKAEPMYLEAINILEESFGQDDVRIAAALHNLGQFYLMQRKLEQARGVYELRVYRSGKEASLYPNSQLRLWSQQEQCYEPFKKERMLLTILTGSLLQEQKVFQVSISSSKMELKPPDKLIWKNSNVCRIQRHDSSWP
ncbi:uncharacterized protein LOC132061110 [Lycium ferocissimum]|uniref:uncharacterized protein LOC132061110 n=1 Tax=Lycium ferocissimum TaxID=112874 RepID=UPI002814ADC3|nr:uncharacterized protein LOC132061110 [Lycium ferocissimum]